MVHAAHVVLEWKAGVTDVMDGTSAADVADHVKGSMGLAMGAGLAMRGVVDRRVHAARCAAGQMVHAAREAKAAARCAGRDRGVTSAGCVARGVAKDVVRVDRMDLMGVARHGDRVDPRGVAVGVAHARTARCAAAPRAGPRCAAHAAVASTARARRAARKVAAVPKAGPSAVRARTLMARGTIAEQVAASCGEK
jgi:hypothetical protein